MFRKLVCVLCLVMIMTVSFVPSVFAQSGEPPVPAAPVNGNYVLDTLGWLTPAQIGEINTIVSDLDTHEMAEIGVVTLDDCGPDSQSYRTTLFRTWGIGHKGKDDGLLILVCWYGGDKSRRKLEQEVGYKMEATIPDLMTSKVAAQYFVAAFKTGKDATKVVSDGDAGAALVKMVKAYDAVIRGNTPAELKAQPQADLGTILMYGVLMGIPCWLWLIIFIILIVLFLRWVGSNSDGGGFSGGGYSSYSSGSSSSSSSSSFGGGSSGGGGSSSSF